VKRPRCKGQRLRPPMVSVNCLLFTTHSTVALRRYQFILHEHEHERCKLPQRGLERSASRNRMWHILALKYDIWSQKNNDFPENQLTKFRAV